MPFSAKIKVTHILTDSNIGGAGRLLRYFLEKADRERFEYSVILPEDAALIPEIEALGGGAGSGLGTGGMVTKLRAAKIATEAGCDMIIANGAYPEILYDITDGKPVGTRFYRKAK